MAVARPQFYYASPPTPGPVYYKPVNPALFYPSYFEGQFRPARSQEAVAPSEETVSVAETPAEDPVVNAEEREGKADEPAEPAPAAAPAARTSEPIAAPAPLFRSYPAPAPAYQPVPEPAYAPAAYSFEWLVKDDYSKNDYGQKESRNGKNSQGSYHVALPDGRVQTVTYSVDGYGGYVADVTYSGEAQYPDTPVYKPAYKPAPKVYKPAPAPAPYVPAPAPAPYKPVYSRLTQNFHYNIRYLGCIQLNYSSRQYIIYFIF